MKSNYFYSILMLGLIGVLLLISCEENTPIEEQPLLNTDAGVKVEESIIDCDVSPLKEIMDKYLRKQQAIKTRGDGSLSSDFKITAINNLNNLTKKETYSLVEYAAYSYNNLTQKNFSFYDLRDYPVNLVVKENVNGRRYLTTQGSNRELKFLAKNNSDNQKFFIEIFAPSTGLGAVIYTYINGKKHLLRTGYYSSDPKRVFIYAKPFNGSYEYGSDWDFLSGNATVHNNAYVLKNNGSLASDDNNSSSWNIYYKVLGNDNLNRTCMDKYKNSGKQEFEIIPIDQFEIIDLKFDDPENGTLIRKPDFVTTWSYSNGTSLQQSMTTSFSKKASYTSNWSRTTGGSFTLNTSFSTKIPFVASGKISTTLSANYSATYGKSETMQDAQDYNFPIVIAPKTRVIAKAIVGRYEIDLNYTAKVKGKKTGKILTIRGKWTGISCTDIRVDIEERNLNTNSILRKRTIK